MGTRAGEPIFEQIRRVREVLAELEAHAEHHWDYTQSKKGARDVRSIAKRLIRGAQDLEARISQDVFD